MFLYLTSLVKAFSFLSESSEPAPGRIIGGVGVVLVPSAFVGDAQGRQSWQKPLYVGVTHAPYIVFLRLGLGLKT